jgi:hypothetical protein
MSLPTRVVTRPIPSPTEVDSSDSDNQNQPRNRNQKPGARPRARTPKVVDRPSENENKLRTRTQDTGPGHSDIQNKPRSRTQDPGPGPRSRIREKEYKARIESTGQLFDRAAATKYPTTPMNVIRNRVAALLLEQRSKNLPTNVGTRPNQSDRLIDRTSRLFDSQSGTTITKL